MTINEYLNQPRTLKARRDKALENLKVLETRMLSPHDPLNLGDGTPRSRSGENTHETHLIEYIDAGKEFKESNRLYMETRDNLEAAINYLLYWQGRLIYQVYIYNVIIEAADDLNGADEILKTKSQREILAKLTEAKAALADQLRAQGVEIE